MIDLETEMKEFGGSIQHNTHNTRSLIRTLRYFQDIIANERDFYS